MGGIIKMELIDHSSNVCKLSIELGKELKLNDQELKYLSTAALLHDIGKVKIPRSILYKKEALTNKEWDLIKQHTYFGANILKEKGYNKSIIDAVLHHHERYDGKGYLYGLKGEEIPLFSRIITLVDSYDAMIANRVYSKGIPEEKAIQEIKNNRNLQFDPYLSTKFTNLLERNIYHARNYKKSLKKVCALDLEGR